MILAESNPPVFLDKSLSQSSPEQSSESLRIFLPTRIRIAIPPRRLPNMNLPRLTLSTVCLALTFCWARATTTIATPVTLVQGGAAPGPTVAGGVLTLNTPVNGQNNIAAFDLSDPGIKSRLEFSFEFRILSANPAATADGFAFIVADTGVHGATGEIAIPRGEEPNVPGVIGLAFDTWNNDVDAGQDGSDLSQVSFHFDGNTLDELDTRQLQTPFAIDDGAFHYVRGIIDFERGLVTVLIRDEFGLFSSIYVELFVPGLTMMESRVAFAGRTGAENERVEIRNLLVDYLPKEPGLHSGLRFASAAHSISEDATQATITVLRTGDTTGTAKVDYSTGANSATAPEDFVPASGTLIFAPGETSKTITVKVVNDSLMEGDEMFLVGLLKSSNAVIASPSLTEVTIRDEDRVNVTSLNDGGNGSLREAIRLAHGGDRIGFATNLQGTIRLMSGELLFDKPLILAGPGAGQLAISGNFMSRVLRVGPQGNAEIHGLTITEGLVEEAGGADATFADAPRSGGYARGGGILNLGILRMFDCMIVSNRVEGGTGGAGYSSLVGVIRDGAPGGPGVGAGIYSEGALELYRCTLAGNRAIGGQGGAGGTAFTLVDAPGAGTGGYSSGAGAYAANARLENCTVAGNFSLGGRSGPSADFSGFPWRAGVPGGPAAGGGLSGGFVLRNCTVASNTVTGGLGGTGTSAGAAGPTYGGGVNVVTLEVRGSIIADNSGAATGVDVLGAAVSGGWNLIGNTDGSNGWRANDYLGTSASPLSAVLGSLQDNGGLVWTMCPLAGSPARDKGRSELVTDARGGRRIVNLPGIPDAPGGDGSDIGAAEVDSLFGSVALTKTGDVVRVRFKSDPGNNYQLIQTGVLTNRVWTNVMTLPGTGRVLEAVDFAANGSPRFYRVVSE